MAEDINSKEIQKLTEQMQTLQIEFEEMSNKYLVSIKEIQFKEMENKDIRQQLKNIKQENNELKEANIDLMRNQNEFENERNNIFKPLSLQLDKSYSSVSRLQTTLNQKIKIIKELKMENTQIRESNAMYMQKFEVFDDKLNQKEIKMNKLNKEIHELKCENDVLSQKLLECKSDFLFVRKQQVVDEEKVPIELLEIKESEINVIVTDLYEDGCSDNEQFITSRSSSTGPADSEYFDGVQPLILNKSANTLHIPQKSIDGRKTSICLSLNDLASIMEKNKKMNSFRSALINICDEEQNDFNDDNLMISNSENRLLVETHLEIQNGLKLKIKKKQKRINALKEQNDALRMTLSKKSCNLMPWCRA